MAKKMSVSAIVEIVACKKSQSQIQS